MSAPASSAWSEKRLENPHEGHTQASELHARADSASVSHTGMAKARDRRARMATCTRARTALESPNFRPNRHSRETLPIWEWTGHVTPASARPTLFSSGGASPLAPPLASSCRTPSRVVDRPQETRVRRYRAASESPYGFG